MNNANIRFKRIRNNFLRCITDDGGIIAKYFPMAFRANNLKKVKQLDDIGWIERCINCNVQTDM